MNRSVQYPVIIVYVFLVELPKRRLKLECVSVTKKKYISRTESFRLVVKDNGKTMVIGKLLL